MLATHAKPRSSGIVNCRVFLVLAELRGGRQFHKSGQLFIPRAQRNAFRRRDALQQSNSSARWS